ncbi:MAG: thioredoxin domain-containing protein [Gammaproteobacteria bacterium]|nr:MAG: thioredoxin domain-containing protein [Gammaproteobacteria bacterium]
MHNLYRIFPNLLAALIFSLLTVSASAEDGHDHAPITNFVEGKHYHRISPAVETDVEDGQVEVLELFWYGCPHCFQFEPHLSGWKDTKADYISFIRMPAVLNRGWLAHARAYYALETMGELERMHPIFFEAIHVQGRRLRDVESMARFLSQHDVDADKFKSAYDSLYVETKINRSGQMVRQYGSSSVPTIIINGKYRTSAGDAGGFENVLRIINMLAEKEAGIAAANLTEESAE